MAEGSTYAIRDGRFSWTGDLGSGRLIVQQADLELKTAWGLWIWNPFSSATAEELGRLCMLIAGAQKYLMKYEVQKKIIKVKLV